MGENVFQSPLFGTFTDEICELLNDKRGLTFEDYFVKPIYHEGFIQWGSAVFLA